MWTEPRLNSVFEPIRLGGRDGFAPLRLTELDLATVGGAEVTSVENQAELSDIARAHWFQDSMTDQVHILAEIAGPLQDARKLVEDMGWVWRGVAAYTPRLCPVVAVAHPQHLDAAVWLKVKSPGPRELVHA